MLRVGTERTNQIMGAQFRVAFGRTERTREGVLFYRMYDLVIARDHVTALRAAFTILHPIGPGSPLRGYDAGRLRREEGEILVTVSGVDETTLQPVHAAYTYDDAHVLFDRRPADILEPLPDGSIRVDLTRFHDTVAVEDTG
jgi:inward rectifier potassium channel